MPRTRIPRHLSLALGVMLFVSCSNPQMVCGCLPMQPVALVYGSVTGPGGAAAAGARVIAEWSEGCEGLFHLAGQVQASADGRYRMPVSVLDGAPALCLRAFAQPAAAGTLRGSDTIPFEVDFSPQGLEDSVRVDLVLRAP